MADFHVPHVLQYIKVKESHGQLKKSIKEWERKVEIAEVRILQTLFFIYIFFYSRIVVFNDIIIPDGTKIILKILGQA